MALHFDSDSESWSTDSDLYNGDHGSWKGLECFSFVAKLYFKENVFSFRYGKYQEF